MAFHVRITTKRTKGQPQRELARGDLTKSELEQRFLGPYGRGEPITIRGVTVRPEELEKIEVRESDEPLALLRERMEARHREDGYVNLAWDPDYLAVGDARDRTDDFIVGAPGHAAPQRERSQTTTVPGRRASTDSPTVSGTVFVVHGRDRTNTDALFTFLRALGLDAREFSSLIANSGEGAPYVGDLVRRQIETSGAVVVLLTPDDEAVLREPLRSSADDAKTRRQARPNVLFEAGIAMASERPKTVFVQVGDVSQFSDVVGRHTVHFDGSHAKRKELAERLRALGCRVDTAGDQWERAGDFAL
jgi:predicted nucleotide-binding protein